jgi:hypothetical protein
MNGVVAPERMPIGGWPAAGRMIAVLAAAACLENCARGVRQVDLPAAPAAVMDELWRHPAELSTRDLLHGPGGRRLVPTNETFEFIARDTQGFSPGFDVRDSAGVEWSVKTGPEAQSEVVASRILWAIGFHQPPTYYVKTWSLSGSESGPQPPGRFRPDLSTYEVIADWSWYENPFVGSRPFGGLIVANLILNNWDWKASNNKIYRLSDPAENVRHWFVVRDVGASLGKTTYPALLRWVKLRGFGQGTRNDVAAFEEQGFIKRIREDGRIEFDYRGMYRDLLDTVTPDDVRWACELMSRLSDEQWDSAFRAGGYDADETARFVRKIKSKIAQGLDITRGRPARIDSAQ